MSRLFSLRFYTREPHEYLCINRPHNCDLTLERTSESGGYYLITGPTNRRPVIEEFVSQMEPE